MENNEESDRPSAASSLIPSLLSAIWRFRVWVLLSAVGGTLFGVFRGVVTPNQYRSVGKLFVRPGIRDAVSPEAAFSGSSGGASRSAGSREAVMNEMQVLSAPQLFDKVVAQLGVDVLMAPYDPAASDGGSVPWHTRMFHNFQTWWFSPASGPVETDIPIDAAMVASLVLAEAVTIYPEAGASVIAVSYTAQTPEVARTVVNAVLDAAQRVHFEVFDTMSSLGKIEEEMRSAERIAREAEKLLREFRVEKVIYDYETQRDASLTYLGDLSRQLDVIDADLRRKQAERGVYAALATTVPEERVSSSFVANPLYGSLNDFVLQLRILDLSLDTEKSISDGERATREAKLAKALLDATTRLEQEGLQLKVENREENPHHTRIAQSLGDLDIALKGLESQKVQVEAVRQANKTQLADFEALSSTLRTLELDARQKRTTADRLAEGVANMRTVQRLEQMNLSSIGVMHSGTLEPNKVAPRRSQLVFLGAFGGVAFGVALALLLSFRDAKVRNRHDVVRLGVPADALLRSEDSGELSATEPWSLPMSLADARSDIARFWAALPYDRRAKAGLKIAFVPCDSVTGAGRAAAALAIGLAVHAGERVAYVACNGGSNWLSQRLGLAPSPGWSEVLRGEVPLEQALVATGVSGLSYVPIGAVRATGVHPLAGPAFLELIDRLCVSHRFVVVELPDLAHRPEGLSVLSVVEATELVVSSGQSTKASVRDAVAAVRTAGARLIGGIFHESPEVQAAGSVSESPEGGEPV